jgi:osmotically-inducible protein OsmY
MVSSIVSKLREKVEAKLREDPQVKDFPIEVLNNNGVITLQGEVPSEAVSMTAAGLTRQVDGVVHVINELRIEKSARRRGTPPAPAVPPTQR